MNNLKKQLNNKFSTYFIVNSTVLVFFILGLLWLQLIKTDTVEAPKCEYKKITGKDCPTCGITRDFVSISKFEDVELHINSKSIYYFYFFAYIVISRFFIVIVNLFKKLTKIFIITDIIFSFLAFLNLIVFAYFLM